MPPDSVPTQICPCWQKTQFTKLLLKRFTGLKVFHCVICPPCLTSKREIPPKVPIINLPSGATAKVLTKLCNNPDETSHLRPSLQKSPSLLANQVTPPKCNMQVTNLPVVSG